MSDGLIKLGIGTAVAIGAVAGGLYLSHKFRHKVREDVRDWLHRNNLAKTRLTDVLMVCDRVAGQVDKVTCKIFVETQEKGQQVVSEETYSLEQLQKMHPDIAERLTKGQSAQDSILKLIT